MVKILREYNAVRILRQVMVQVRRREMRRSREQASRLFEACDVRRGARRALRITSRAIV